MRQCSHGVLRHALRCVLAILYRGPRPGMDGTACQGMYRGPRPEACHAGLCILLLCPYHMFMRAVKLHIPMPIYVLPLPCAVPHASIPLFIQDVAARCSQLEKEKTKVPPTGTACHKVPHQHYMSQGATPALHVTRCLPSSCALCSQLMCFVRSSCVIKLLWRRPKEPNWVDR